MNRTGKGTFKEHPENINRTGKNKGSISVVAILKRKIQEMPPGQKKTYAELLVERMLKMGIVEGDVQMIKEINNRIDGQPKSTLGVENKVSFHDAMAEEYQRRLEYMKDMKLKNTCEGKVIEKDNSINNTNPKNLKMAGIKS